MLRNTREKEPRIAKSAFRKEFTLPPRAIVLRQSTGLRGRGLGEGAMNLASSLGVGTPLIRPAGTFSPQSGFLLNFRLDCGEKGRGVSLCKRSSGAAVKTDSAAEPQSGDRTPWGRIREFGGASAGSHQGSGEPRFSLPPRAIGRRLEPHPRGEESRVGVPTRSCGKSLRSPPAPSRGPRDRCRRCTPPCEAALSSPAPATTPCRSFRSGSGRVRCAPATTPT